MESIYRPEVLRLARMLADIFRVLLWAVAGLGVLASVAAAIAAASGGALEQPGFALLIGVGGLVVTFVWWAQLALAYVIVGYVAVRLDENRPDEPLE